MTVQLSRQDMAEMRLAAPVARSSFVRRLLQAHEDPARQRIRAWLMKIDDAQLLTFGLTPEDITALRGTAWRIASSLRSMTSRLEISAQDNGRVR